MVLTGMEEARISYLCTQAARGEITLEEWSELLGHMVLEPEIWEMIVIEFELVQIKY